jgi:hypothetical protein
MHTKISEELWVEAWPGGPREEHGPEPLELVSDQAFLKWRDAGYALALDMAQHQFTIGYWIVEGEDLKEVAGNPKGRHAIYSAASDITGLNVATVKDYAYVARHVPPSVRVPTLAFGHHKLIAGLPEVQQREWLSEMQLGKLSVREARRKMQHRAGKQDHKPEPELTSPADKRAMKIIQLCKPLVEVLSENTFDEVSPLVSRTMVESLEAVRKLVADELFQHLNISVDR